MAAADARRVVAQIYALLGRPSLLKLPKSDVDAARIASGTDVLKAIAANAQNGFHGSLATLVTVAHGAFLPAHDGEPGIPVITLFSGGPAVEGVPATADEIESFRMAPTNGKLIYSGGFDGIAVAHNAADANNMPSPVAGRYSLVKHRLKFSGFSAQVPLIQLTRTMADTGVPDSYEPTLVKLALPQLVKPGHPMYARAEQFYRLGVADLKEISDGAMVVSPVPDVAAAQQMGVA